MSKTFRKFSSIENHYRDKFVNSMELQGLTGGEWVATEKVHGANYSYWYDGADLWHGKRSGVCGDDFFGSHKIHKYDPQIELTYEALEEAGVLEFGDTMVIYGEIFGGNFFGDKEGGSKVVQRGVDYHPGTEFMAYDVQILAADEERNDKILSYAEMVLYVAEEIPLCPELERGTFYDMIALENDFPSKVPGVFGLEAPEGKKSQCEGFVMRPVNGEKFLGNGVRCIIKSKNAVYSEKGGNKVNAGSSGKSLQMSEVEMAKYAEVSAYLNNARLESVISKIGEVKWSDFGKVSGLLIQDAMVDFEKDTDTNLRDGEFWSKAKKPLGGLAGDIVREYFKSSI